MPTTTKDIRTGENDPYLLKALAAGDMQAFRELYEIYQPRLAHYLHSFCEKDQADDILQDVFVKLWQRRTLLSGIQVIEFYLQRMARNRWLDQRKTVLIRQKHESGFSAVSSSETYNPEEAFTYKEYHHLANEAIRSLPERRRQILKLSLLYGKTLAEIAIELGLSKAVVKKQLYLANHAIKEYLRKNGDISLILLLILKMEK